ncbi:MAG: hypothetical protein WAV54_12230 [Acidimicrobiales bacterium]
MTVVGSKKEAGHAVAVDGSGLHPCDGQYASTRGGSRQQLCRMVSLAPQLLSAVHTVCAQALSERKAQSVAERHAGAPSPRGGCLYGIGDRDGFELQAVAHEQRPR